jgi:prophage antirepressor-like protein
MSYNNPTTKDDTHNEIKAPMNTKNICGVDCYEQNGVAYLRLENVARGLGFTRIAASGNKVIMWSRVEKYLEDLGVHTCAHEDFIPENIFYRLAMKAKNETAEKFQALVADEIIPSIRKNGIYATDNVIDEILNNPDFGIELLTKLKKKGKQELKQKERTLS